MSHLLERFVGRWEGQETISETRWGPGGSADAIVEGRFDLGEKLLLQDYRERRDGKPSLAVHAVFAAGPEHDQCALFWFDSYGFVPSAPASGTWDGQRLIFVRCSPRGQARHVYEFPKEGTYTMRLESSFDGGVSWEPVMSGTYRRVD